jgi:hypothetical protein
MAECLTTCRDTGAMDALPGFFQSQLATANQHAWLLATGEDYRYREAEGPPPGRITRLTHRYLDRVTAVANRVPSVRLKLTEVLHLIRPPASLFGPGVMLRALFG